ncbi:MAG: Smr/MutS family protein [Hyphomicrobiaceae bacterium]|nr:MAG: Smr/MutS family protein [Hyphomicrobiaceae bacterium]
MSRSGRQSPGGSRAVTPEEVELWDHATRALKPIKAKQRVGAAASADQPAARAPAAAASRKAVAPVDLKQAPLASPRTKVSKSPPLAEFDRRAVRRITAGKAEIEARIDLHGDRQKEARARLRAFLLDNHAKGRRTVLVITGKGEEQERGDHLGDALGQSRRGVLRRSVPLWLEEPDMRAIVVSYTAAGIRHGGEGALYIQLRRSRD